MLPASGTAAPGVPVIVTVAAAAVSTSVAVIVGALAVVEVTTPLGTLVGFKVPQMGQSSEPGVSLRHCSNWAMQIELGIEPI